MSAEEIVDLGFDGLRKQRTPSLAQNIRELIVECSWLNQFRDGIVRHGISLLQWRSGGSSTPTICRLTDSCRHQLLAIALARLAVRTAVPPNFRLRAAQRRLLCDRDLEAGAGRKSGPRNDLRDRSVLAIHRAAAWTDPLTTRGPGRMLQSNKTDRTVEK